MKATDEQIVRVFKQLQGGFGELRPESKNVFGMVMGFITTTFQLCDQMRQARRLPQAVEEAQRQLLADFRKSGKLAITQSELDQKDIGQQSNADLRHLRNCFAHGNWTYDETQMSKANLTVKLYDFNSANPPVQRFHATINLVDLAKLAEQLMVETSQVIVPTTSPSSPTPSANP
jgi:hypothetical protein